MTDAGTYLQIDYDRLREVLDRGAQLVEVLPPAEFAELHLPGVVNIPLRGMDENSAAILTDPDGRLLGVVPRGVL